MTKNSAENNEEFIEYYNGCSFIDLSLENIVRSGCIIDPEEPIMNRSIGEFDYFIIKLAVRAGRSVEYSTHYQIGGSFIYDYRFNTAKNRYAINYDNITDPECWGNIIKIYQNETLHYSRSSYDENVPTGDWVKGDLIFIPKDFVEEIPKLYKLEKIRAYKAHMSRFRF